MMAIGCLEMNYSKKNDVCESHSLIMVSVMAELKEKRFAMTAENGQGQKERGKTEKRTCNTFSTVLYLNSSVSIG